MARKDSTGSFPANSEMGYLGTGAAPGCNERALGLLLYCLSSDSHVSIFLDPQQQTSSQNPRVEVFKLTEMDSQGEFQHLSLW